MLHPRKRSVVDPDTGEMHLVEKEKRAAYGLPRDERTGKRHMVFGTVAAEELRRCEYTGATFRVLIHLAYITDDTGVIDQTQEEIAEETGLSQQSVSRAMKQLKEDRYIERRGTVWYLNHHAFYTGSSEKWHQVETKAATHRRTAAAEKPKRSRRSKASHLVPVS